MDEKNEQRISWIPIDKRFRYFLPIDRPYTRLEAMLSFTLDMDEGNDISIRGYSNIWVWSRNKVRKFLEEIRTTQGHFGDRIGATKGQPVTFINKDLWQTKGRKRATKGPLEGHLRATTIDPNPNTNPNPKERTKDKYGDLVFLFPEQYQKLVDKYQEDFTKACIYRLDNWLGSSGKTRVDHYKTILSWVVEAEKEKGDWVE